MALIDPADLDPFATIDPAKLSAMIADASAMAVLAAPCLADESALSDEQRAAAKAVLRGAILRWDQDPGLGIVQQQTAGPFSQSYSQQPRRGMFWPSELTQLARICDGVGTGGAAFTIDTTPTGGGTLPAPGEWVTTTDRATP